MEMDLTSVLDDNETNHSCVNKRILMIERIYTSCT